MTPSAASLAPSVVFERPADRAAELRGRPGEIRFLEVAPVRAVLVDGHGQVGEAAFAPRMPGLYATAYGLRFTLKRRTVDVRIGMLEGLYWMADGSTDFDAILGPDRDTWRWTLLIALPDEATETELAAALAAGRAKMPADLAPELRVETFDEGRVAQVLHLGPYAEERPTIERAPRGDRGGRPSPARTAPRALPRRSPTVEAGTAQDADPPARRAGLTHPRGWVAPASSLRARGTARRRGTARSPGVRRPTPPRRQ